MNKKLFIAIVIFCIAVIVYGVFKLGSVVVPEKSGDLKTASEVKNDIKSYLKALPPSMQEKIGSLYIVWKYEPDDGEVNETAFYFNEEGKVRTFEITIHLKQYKEKGEQNILPQNKIRKIAL